MTRKRSRLEIYLDVLKTIRSGINKPTNIMYKCNLSWLPLKDLLDSLVNQDLIRIVENENRRTYEITEKGRNVLRYFEKAKDLLVIERRKEAEKDSVTLFQRL